MKKFITNNSEYFYLGFRVIIGLVFFLHGLMKMQMLVAGKIGLFDLMGMAMLIEVIGGLLIILGLYTRTTATIAALEMAYAFLFIHGKAGLNPLSNNGEPALLFFAAFLVLVAYGADKISLDHRIKNR